MKIKLLSILMIILMGLKIQAQQVYIPDPNFRSYLQDYFPNCMNGDYLNGNCNSVTSCLEMYVIDRGINNLEGIQAFVNLQFLYCGYNNLSNLPPLPPNLLTLSCQGNQFYNLTNLPINLEGLACDYNYLNTLPELPNSLKGLSFEGNSISIIPNLPSGLESLVCGYNLINNLPELPLGLKYIDAKFNNITVLPDLPTSIEILRVASNPIQITPILPAGLKELDISGINTNTIPIFPASLEILYITDRSLTILPPLPINLLNLDFGGNQISTFSSLPPNLKYLSCGFNQLTSLPSLPSSLETITCNNNLITSFPSLPINLKSLSCVNNQLSNLPPLPSSLRFLSCSNNQILYLPSLPDLFSLKCNNNLIGCLPPLPISLINSSPQFFNISNNPFTCLPNYVPAMNAQTLAIPLCDENNSNGCPAAEGVIGRVYKDQNNNCIQSTNELHAINIAVKLYDDLNNLLVQSATFSNNGIYNIPLANGNYKVKIDTLNKPYRITCTNPGDSINFTLTPAQPLFNAPNFPVRCKPGFDVGVQSVVPVGWVFPGQTHTLRVLAGDMSQWMNLNCAQGIAGQVQITVNGPVTYSGVPAGALVPVVSGNVFTYTIANFANANFQNSFRILFATDTTAQAGDPICVNVSVTPTSGDNVPANNQMQFCYSVINSYDPNRKDVSPAEVLPGYEDWITYTVYFQNTGNAPAFNIRLRDTLSSYFDYSTFELLNYSHPNTYDLRDGILNFLFPNIMLPDSASNPPGSIGFVQFRMKPLAGLPFGQQINNQVAIYFDFNPPIFTNIANTSFTQCGQFASTLQVNECESATINNVTYTESGTYFQNLQNINGCDSLLTVQVSINKNEVMLNQSACGEYVLNEVIYNQSGTYQQTLINSLGCDSLVTLNLTIKPTQTENLIIQACESYTWNNLVYTESGDYQQVYVNSAGCDSLVTLNLTIKPTQTENFNIQACESYTWNNLVYTESGDYQQVYVNSVGCDSLVTLNLTIRPSQTENFNIQACESYTWNNLVYTESGDYQQLYVNSVGCDSLVTMNLTINPVDVIIQNVNEQLIASALTGNFQWIDCDNGFAPIIGADGNIFTPNTNGNFAVVYTAENCEQTSDCFNVNWLNIENLKYVFNIFPVPTNDLLQIQCLNCLFNNQEELTYSIIDVQGRLVLQSSFSNLENTQTLSLAHLASGSYFLHISNANKRLMSKVFLKQ